jgi:MFS family permease
VTASRALSRAALGAFLAVPFLDEAESGIFPTALPELEAELGIGGATAFAVVTAAIYLVVIAVEAPLFARADRARDPRRWLRVALCGVAASCLCAAWSPGLVGLAVSMGLFGPASGIVCGLAQGAYVGGALHEAERRMARWTLAGALGDIAGPGLVGAVLALGLGWRTAFVVAAGAALLLAAFMPAWPKAGRDAGLDTSGATADADFGEADPEDAPRAPLREALAIPGVWPWVLATAACTFLDEIVLAFAALQVSVRFGPGPEPRALVLGALVGASAIGLVGLERVVHRFDPRRLLVATAIGSALSLAASVLAPTPALAAAAAALLGLTGAAHYPLAQAQAYRAAPGRPGAVNAVAALLLPLEVAIPFGLAALAAAAGPDVALLALGAQPVVLLVVCFAARR